MLVMMMMVLLPNTKIVFIHQRKGYFTYITYYLKNIPMK